MPSTNGLKTYQDPYDLSVTDRHWLLRYIRLQNTKDKETSEILARAYEESEAILRGLERIPDSISSQVLKTQLSNAKKQLGVVVVAIYSELSAKIKTGQEEAAALAAKLMLEDESEIWDYAIRDKAVRKNIETTEVARARRNIQAVVARNQHSSRTLSQRIYSSQALQKGIVDRRINVLMARGASPAQIAKEMRPYFKESVPGGVTFAAKRLARTEVNNAFHAQSIQDMKDRPWITHANWNLSKSHPVDQIQCLCDKYAIQRVFRVEDIPDKPHPQCLCSITPEIPPVSQVLASHDLNKWANR